jgi:hypothetical protein
LKDLVTKNILLARNKKFIGKVYRMEKIEYQAFTNQNNKNNNISRINELLERIGTNSKSLFNKLKFKKSKSVKFLELIDENLEKILENINLDNIERQFNKSKKLFEKLLVDFKEKIKNKSTNNKERLQTQIDVIYNKYHNFFSKFSDNISNIKNWNPLTIEQLNKLLSIQEELIELFKFYYKKYFRVNGHLYKNDSLFFLNKKYLKSMEIVKKIISRKIYYMTPNVQSRNINDLFLESDSLYNRLIEMPESEIIKLTKQQKKELSAYIKDLVKFIYNETVSKNKVLSIEVLKKSIKELNKLSNLYYRIFQKEYIAFTRNRKYSQFEEWNNIIPNKNTYENIQNVRVEIESFINTLIFLSRQINKNFNPQILLINNTYRKV